MMALCGLSIWFEICLLCHINPLRSHQVNATDYEKITHRNRKPWQVTI